MMPDDLIRVGKTIASRWSLGAIIYSTQDMPKDAVLVVDHDEPLPHNCDGEIDCSECMGMYHRVAWVDIMGGVHEVHEVEKSKHRACIICWTTGHNTEATVFVDPGWYCAEHNPLHRRNHA